jgi:carbamoyl-phosphate synthase/aspartate carbamoyltransferase/dihydroorotase
MFLLFPLLPFQTDRPACALFSAAAALAGGITLVLAMPNTSPSITDSSSLSLVKNAAAASARCDYGLYMGANDSNAEDLRRIVEEEGVGKEEEMKHNGVSALKMYLNDTFSTLKLPDMESWMSHFRTWPRELPIVCHAEGQTMGAVILLSQVRRHSSALSLFLLISSLLCSS